MMGQLLEAGFYVLLALAATAVNWQRRSWVAGVALVVFSLVSSFTFFTVSFEWKVLREIALATLMLTLSFELWISGVAMRSNQVVMALCILDLGFCGVICAQASHSNLMQWSFAVVVNALFIGMCAAVAAPGIRDGVRRWSSAVDGLRRDRGEAAAVDVHAPPD
ncbi:MAG: hypothetical protein ABW128_06735 [Rhizorhabdus sp.]